MIDVHVAQSMAAHSAEIRAVYNLMREVHAHVARNAPLGEDCELPAAPLIPSVASTTATTTVAPPDGHAR